MPLSDRIQALILTISIFLISLPAVTPESFSPLMKWIIIVVGLAGIAIKELAGSKAVPAGATPQ